MNKHWITGSLATLGLLLCAAWALGYFSGDYSEDPEVAAVEKLREEKFANPEAMSEQEMRSAGEALKKQAAGLSREQQMSLWERSMPIFMPMMMKRSEVEIDKFLALSPEEQRSKMDEKINEQLARQKERKASGGNAQGPGGRGGKPKLSPEKADEFKKKMNDWTTPEQRAKFEVMMDMYNERREERGLDPAGPGRWK